MMSDRACWPSLPPTSVSLRMAGGRGGTCIKKRGIRIRTPAFGTDPRVHNNHQAHLKEPDMRLIVVTLLTLPLLLAAAFSGLAIADDAPERSRELNVLDQIAGTWKVVITSKTGDQESTQTVYATREWSSDGQFLLEHDRLTLDSRVSGSRGAWTYDPEAKSYRFVLLTRNLAFLSTCQWNEKTRTMTLHGVDHAGNVATSPLRVINRDYLESSTVIRNSDGDVIMEMTHKQTRVKTKVTLAAKTGAAGIDGDQPERSPELQVLDRFIGDWDEKVTIKPTGGAETTINFVSRRRWTFGGTILQIEDAHNLHDPEAREFQILWTYGPVAKNYPAVLMGGPIRGELTGTCDAKTTTMHWTGKSPD